MNFKSPIPETKPIAYRVEEAARISGLSRSTLYALRAKGQLAFKRVAGRSLILRKDLEALIEGGQHV